jgi:hypothetical protein
MKMAGEEQKMEATPADDLGGGNLRNSPKLRSSGNRF